MFVTNTPVNATQITVAESVVMEALWQRSPLSAEGISDEIAEAQGWSFGTVKTLISRLLKKGAIAASPDRRRFLYSPTFERADYVLAESQSLLDRLFSGRLAPLVSHFSEARQLSPEDIEELERLLAELRR